MRVKTKSGSVIQLVGFKAEYDCIFLLIELVNRTPDAFLACTRSDREGIHIVRVGELQVDGEEIAFLNQTKLGKPS